MNKGMLKASTLSALVLAAACASGARAHDGQDHSRGATGNVRDLIADLYGGNGITLDPNIVFHSAHFAASAQEALSNLSNVVSAGIGAFSFNSTVSGVSFSIEEGVPVRSQDSLGPLLAERATTIGRNQINLGFSYTNINFKRLDGRSIDRLQVTLDHDQVTGEPFERDVIRLDIDLNLRQQIIAFFGTYGVTNNLDVGFVVPLIKVDGQARSVASIVDQGGGGIHRFGGIASPVSTTRANATGIGDILVRAKYVFNTEQASKIDFGVLAQATLATGDEKDLLGTGSSAIYVGGIASANWGKLNPHINVGYEHFIDQPRTPGVEVDRSNVRAIAGFDVRARDNFSIAPEVLGRWQSDGRKFYDFALGVKWAPTGDVPINANIVVPINRNEGLRPDFYFTVGIESTF